MNVNILFEDKHLIIAHKPAGIASQTDPSGRADMITLLREKTGGDIFCVHRLDTATSGVMVYAKSSECAGRLTASLSADDKIKEYLCVVHSPDAGAGRMEDLLFHDKRKNKAYVVDRMRGGVKTARLDYETLSKKDGLSLVKVTLDTGRTHQIRVQFASRKMPLLGDGKYGSRDNLPLALHCFHLGFTHPYTKKYVDTVSFPDSPFGLFDLEDVTV
ncbi:MAG: RluA family pseudouridine synthase [Clostridia bacterium]|nr:RluA family pseudouridine synthase [Clostridia bacterium]